MSIPLVQNNDKDAINTSIIAIKRNIERINMLLGLSNSEEIDTSEFVKKSDIVDEVTVGNMQSVTSNAVAEVMEVVYVSGKTDPGGNFRDINNNSFDVSQYSYAQLLNTSGANGYIMIPYKNAGQTEAQSTWAVYNLASHSWVTNANNLTAIFKK